MAFNEDEQPESPEAHRAELRDTERKNLGRTRPEVVPSAEDVRKAFSSITEPEPEDEITHSDFDEAELQSNNGDDQPPAEIEFETNDGEPKTVAEKTEARGALNPKEVKDLTTKLLRLNGRTLHYTNPDTQAQFEVTIHAFDEEDRKRQPINKVSDEFKQIIWEDMCAYFWVDVIQANKAGNIKRKRERLVLTWHPRAIMGSYLLDESSGIDITVPIESRELLDLIKFIADHF